MDSRLDGLAPELAAVLHGAPPTQLWRIVEVACSLALATAELNDPRADAAFTWLRRGGRGDSAERRSLEALAAELDRSAGAARPPGGRDGAPGRAFAQARAATALWCALGEDPLRAALECLYEANHAGVDLDVLRLVTSTA
ncbi:MAG TPA: hypothetical protein VKG45_06370 [Actinomycetes bacterium]|nr:hypothetical protein [Actinomycetes bacterium]